MTRYKVCPECEGNCITRKATGDTEYHLVEAKVTEVQRIKATCDDCRYWWMEGRSK